jgi:hypothetical protein
MSAPCGKVCVDCPMFGTSCEGCEKEMSFSFAYHCKVYDQSLSGEQHECTGMPCKTVEGKACLCPLVLLKSQRPIAMSGLGPNSPVE